MSEDIRSSVNQAKLYLKNQSYKKAESILKKLLSEDCPFADVQNMMGLVYHHQGQFSQAIDAFKQALKINPSYTEALLNLGVLYNDLGEYQQARLVINKSNKTDQNSKKVVSFFKAKLANKHAELGGLYQGLAMFSEAVREYDRALELAPSFQDIRCRKALALRDMGKKTAALAEYQKIAREKPDYLEAQIQLGVTYYSLGKIAEAQKVWQKLSQDHPKHALLKVYLRLDASKTKKPQAARAKK